MAKRTRSHQVARAAGLGIVAGLSGMPGAAASNTAQVQVQIRVAACAEVELSRCFAIVTLPTTKGAKGYCEDFGPLYVGGTIQTNVPVRILAEITPPACAPGEWSVTVRTPTLSGACKVQDPKLLSISVKKIPWKEGGGSYWLWLKSRFLRDGSNTVMPSAGPTGTVMVTVIPQ